MDTTTRTRLDNIRSEDRELQNKAFTYLLEATQKPVDWAYEAWDELVKGLSDKDNHVRAIASQLLATLAKSDPEKRILKISIEDPKYRLAQTHLPSPLARGFPLRVGKNSMAGWQFQVQREAGCRPSGHGDF